MGRKCSLQSQRLAPKRSSVQHAANGKLEPKQTNAALGANVGYR